MSDLFGGLFSAPIEDIPESSGYDRPADGVYAATVTDMYPLDGTKNKPDFKAMIIEYTLEDTGQQVSDLFGMPQNPAHPTEAEAKKVGYFVNRLRDLGVPRDAIQTTGVDDIVGKNVVITLRTRGEYQNITRCDLREGNEPTPAEPARSEPRSQVAGRSPVGATARVQRPNPFNKG